MEVYTYRWIVTTNKPVNMQNMQRIQTGSQQKKSPREAVKPDHKYTDI